MDQQMPSSGCQQQAGPTGATAEVPGVLKGAAATLWSTSLWSLCGADRGVQSTANSGEGGLASCGADPHVHSFFPKKNLLHSYVPRLDCSHRLLLAWAPSPKA